MNNFLKHVIEETFASKKQQRFFYAKAEDKSEPKKERKKWGKMAKEFSDKTDFEHLPDEVDETKEEDVDEIVDEKGNIARGKKPTDLATKGVTSKSTLDQVTKTGAGSMGIYGVHGGRPALRYWGESDMSKALGSDAIEDDMTYDQAFKHFTTVLGLSPEEAKERMEAMGFSEELPNDMIRLVENPKKYMEEYIESVLAKRAKENDLLDKEKPEEVKEVNPIVLKQIKSLKNSMNSHKLSVNDILKHLKNDE